MSHTTDKELLNRLKRAGGHLTTIIKMIEDDRDGLEIAQQMQAVVNALEAAKKTLVIDHIEHHLEDVVGPLAKGQRRSIDEFKEITKYL